MSFREDKQTTPKPGAPKKRPYVDPRYIKTPAQQKARMIEDFLIYALGQRSLREETNGPGAMALLRTRPPHEGFPDAPLLGTGKEIKAYFLRKFAERA